MRLIRLSIIAIAAVILSACSCPKSMEEQLLGLENVTSVTKMESTEFGEKFVLTFEQPIDHKDPSKGVFNQRVFVCHVHPDSATVVVAEGYGAQYAARTGYRDEISRIFNTNNIVVEHRYFLESTPYPETAPEEIDWSYLNAENAANDIHNVITALKSIYDGKWISTGISKGGQNTMIHRSYFPEDVDVSVPYVGPVCKALVDGRHEKFLADYAGTPADREIIFNYQVELLKRKDKIFPKFDSLCKANSLEFNIPTGEIFDLCLLEFPFAFWQWGYPTTEIPSVKSSDQEIFNYMMKIASPDYFEKWSTTAPFFVQAAKELGYYGYDMTPFKKYQKYFDLKTTEDYLHRTVLPQGIRFEFDDYLYKKLTDFISSTDARMVFIYGQFDPWSAVMPDDPGKENIKFFIEPWGSHRARIGTFDEETQNEIKSILSGWLYN